MLISQKQDYVHLIAALWDVSSLSVFYVASFLTLNASPSYIKFI
jgi:hypothetical protein